MHIPAVIIPSAVIIRKLDSTNSPGSNANATGTFLITEVSQQCPGKTKCMAAWCGEDNVLWDLTAVPHGNPVGNTTTWLGLAGRKKTKEDVLNAISEEGKSFCLKIMLSVG